VAETVTVRMLMHTPAVTVAAHDSIADTVKVLNENKVGAAAVLDEQQRLVGMISERDVLHSVGSGADPATTTAIYMPTRTLVALVAMAIVYNDRTRLLFAARRA